jgi:hypothetical protein
MKKRQGPKTSQYSAPAIWDQVSRGAPGVPAPSPSPVAPPSLAPRTGDSTGDNRTRTCKRVRPCVAARVREKGGGQVAGRRSRAWSRTTVSCEYSASACALACMCTHSARRTGGATSEATEQVVGESAKSRGVRDRASVKVKPRKSSHRARNLPPSLPEQQPSLLSHCAPPPRIG